MTSNTEDGDGKVVKFPLSAEERQALRKAKQDLERQRLIRCFVGEIGNEQALFHTRDGTAYADLMIEGVRQTWPVRSREFRIEYIKFLQREWERLTDEGEVLAVALKPTLRKSAINAAIDDFELRAITSPVERVVHLRVAGDGDEIFIDLCDRDWHAVRITAAGWSIVQSPPVRFRRTKGMQALPFPERGTPISVLKPFLNVADNDFVLVVAYLLAALRPSGPYPILVLYGEQGTAKTNFIRRLRSLVDPNFVATGSLPSSGRDALVAANNSHMQCFENVSKLTDSMSDVLCRMATGGGWRTRALFTNTEETLFTGARPIALEGIANFVARGDFQDRAIILPLDRLSRYRTERELDAAFARHRAGILGALLNLLAQGVRRLPETRLAQPPRMADFAHWAVACGLDMFEAEYRANHQRAIDVILEHDPIAQALQALIVKEWRGTAQELLIALGPAIGITNTKVLSDRLRRLAPLLRSKGLDIRHEQRSASRREITIACRE
jgi:hypothetical protein